MCVSINMYVLRKCLHALTLCACPYTCTHTCTHAHTHVHMPIHMYACPYTCTHVHTRAHAHVHRRAGTPADVNARPHARHAQVTVCLCSSVSPLPIMHAHVHHLCAHVHHACVRAREACRGRPGLRHATRQGPGVMVVECLLSAAAAGQSVSAVALCDVCAGRSSGLLHVVA